MAKAETTEDLVVNAAINMSGEREASGQLAFILVMVCRGAALDQVVNVGVAEGAMAGACADDSSLECGRGSRACCWAS